MFNSRNIKAADILRMEAGLRASVQTEFPSLNVQEGSNLNDILIRALAYTATLITTEAEDLRTRLSLNKIAESDSIDSQSMLEDLASNFLIFNRTAIPAKGILTLRFTSPVPRTIPAEILFVRGDNVFTVKPVDTEVDITVNTDDYLETVIDDATYYDYQLFSESTNDTNQETIVSGTFTSSVSLTGLVSVTNQRDFITFDPNEFLSRDIRSRMELALTSRGFHTKNAIQATILEENIPNLKSVLGIGASDSEMKRDIVPTSVSGEEFHSLGMINVVLSSEPETSSNSITNTSVPNIAFQYARRASRLGTYLSFISDFEYSTTQVYRVVRSVDSNYVTTITSSLVSTGEALPPDSIKISLADSTDTLKYGVAAADKYQIEYAAGEATNCLMDAAVDNNIEIVQALISSSQFNTLGSDTLAISSNVVQILVPDLQIEIVQGFDANSISVANIRTVIQDTINNWTETRAISHIDILSPLSIFLGGVASNITFVGGLKYILYLPDGRDLPYQSTTKLEIINTSYQLQPDIFSATNIESQQISNRTLNYVIYPQDISVQVIQDV